MEGELSEISSGTGSSVRMLGDGGELTVSVVQDLSVVSHPISEYFSILRSSFRDHCELSL